MLAKRRALRALPIVISKASDQVASTQIMRCFEEASEIVSQGFQNCQSRRAGWFRSMFSGIFRSTEGPTEQAMRKGKVGGCGHTITRCPIAAPTHVLTSTAGSPAHYMMICILKTVVICCASCVLAAVLGSCILHVGWGQSWLSPTTSSCRIAVSGFDSPSIRLCQQAIAIRSPNGIYCLCRFLSFVSTLLIFLHSAPS